MLEATAMPAVWLERDIEPGSTWDPGVFEGFGYGLRAALGSPESSLGISYHGLDTATDANDLRTHSLYLDGDVRSRMYDAPEAFLFHAGFGLGGTLIDASDDRDLRSEASAHLRLGIDFQPSDRFVVTAGVGGVVFGHPGDTVAYGTFLMLGATLFF